MRNFGRNLAIARAYVGGESAESIGRRFGVSKCRVGHIYRSLTTRMVERTCTNLSDGERAHLRFLWRDVHGGRRDADRWAATADAFEGSESRRVALGASIEGTPLYVLIQQAIV